MFIISPFLWVRNAGVAQQCRCVLASSFRVCYRATIKVSAQGLSEGCDQKKLGLPSSQGSTRVGFTSKITQWMLVRFTSSKATLLWPQLLADSWLEATLNSFQVALSIRASMREEPERECQQKARPSLSYPNHRSDIPSFLPNSIHWVLPTLKGRGLHKGVTIKRQGSLGTMLETIYHNDSVKKEKKID